MSILATELSPTFKGRLRGLLSTFTRQLSGSANFAAYELGKQLEAALKREFQAGTDKEGISHNKTGETINDTEVHRTAFGAVCSMGGAALLVQEGTKRHMIHADAAPFLQFKWHDQWVRKIEVDHPGYKGDDFAGRAIESLELSNFAATIVSGAYARLLTR